MNIFYSKFHLFATADADSAAACAAETVTGAVTTQVQSLQSLPSSLGSQTSRRYS